TPNPSTTGTYTVSWTGLPGIASGYRLEERQGSGSWASMYYGSGESVPFSGKANGEWRYRVSPCASSTVCGVASNELLVTVQPTGITPPDVPTGLLLTPATSLDGRYSATWNAAARATGYDLQERKFVNGIWQTV